MSASFTLALPELPWSEEEIGLDLVQLQAEAAGWLPLAEGVYLHLDAIAQAGGEGVPVIQVVGVPRGCDPGEAVLLLA